jgi:hypothetical protein
MKETTKNCWLEMWGLEKFRKLENQVSIPKAVLKIFTPR